MIWMSCVYPRRSPPSQDEYTKSTSIYVWKPSPSFLFLNRPEWKESSWSISVSTEPGHTAIILYQPPSPARQDPTRALKMPLFLTEWTLGLWPIALRVAIIFPQTVFRSHLGRAIFYNPVPPTGKFSGLGLYRGFLEAHLPHNSQ